MDFGKPNIYNPLVLFDIFLVKLSKIGLAPKKFERISLYEIFLWLYRVNIVVIGYVGLQVLHAWMKSGGKYLRADDIVGFSLYQKANDIRNAVASVFSFVGFVNRTVYISHGEALQTLLIYFTITYIAYFAGCKVSARTRLSKSHTSQKRSRTGKRSKDLLRKKIHKSTISTKGSYISNKDETKDIMGNLKWWIAAYYNAGFSLDDILDQCPLERFYTTDSEVDINDVLLEAVNKGRIVAPWTIFSAELETQVRLEGSDQIDECLMNIDGVISGAMIPPSAQKHIFSGMIDGKGVFSPNLKPSTVSNIVGDAYTKAIGLNRGGREDTNDARSVGRQLASITKTNPNLAFSSMERMVSRADLAILSEAIREVKEDLQRPVFDVFSARLILKECLNRAVSKIAKFRSSIVKMVDKEIIRALASYLSTNNVNKLTNTRFVKLIESDVNLRRVISLLPYSKVFVRWAQIQEYQDDFINMLVYIHNLSVQEGRRSGDIDCLLGLVNQYVIEADNQCQTSLSFPVNALDEDMEFVLEELSSDSSGGRGIRLESVPAALKPLLALSPDEIGEFVSAVQKLIIEAKSDSQIIQIEANSLFESMRKNSDKDASFIKISSINASVAEGIRLSQVENYREAITGSTDNEYAKFCAFLPDVSYYVRSLDDEIKPAKVQTNAIQETLSEMAFTIGKGIFPQYVRQKHGSDWPFLVSATDEMILKLFISLRDDYSQFDSAPLTDEEFLGLKMAIASEGSAKTTDSIEELRQFTIKSALELNSLKSEEEKMAALRVVVPTWSKSVFDLLDTDGVTQFSQFLTSYFSFASIVKEGRRTRIQSEGNRFAIQYTIIKKALGKNVASAWRIYQVSGPQTIESLIGDHDLIRKLLDAGRSTYQSIFADLDKTSSAAAEDVMGMGSNKRIKPTHLDAVRSQFESSLGRKKV